jgi:uncharacterized caspase-like protein/tetratricopeptide (TPR) repeat protein
VVALLLLAGIALSQTPPKPQQRDLRFQKDDIPVVNEPGKIQIPRSYALVIGISRYKNLPEKGQLKFADRDANEIYTTLISPEGGQFPPDNVHLIVGARATLANLRHELEEWLPSVSKEDDRVLIYFAGHGFVWGGKGYLAPYDVDRDDIPNTAYSMDRLGEVFGAKIKAKWRVLLTDACHSGAILPATDPLTINQSLQNLNRSVFSLTASRDRESSYESPAWGGGHGAFTYFVYKGLQGEADASGDGVVTADELADYVHTNVRRETKQLQNPTSERGSFDPNMVLAYNPTHAQVHPTEAPKFGRLLIETNMDGVEVFVDGQSQGVVNKGTPLPLPGITPGVHVIKAVRMGYEPYGPADHTVYPGQDTTVTISITIVRRKNNVAAELFEQGLTHYTTGNEQNYRKAAELFEKALQRDPSYSLAALYLGSTYNALFDETKADRYFRMAIELDPDYIEARARYAGVLLDKGDSDGAMRQLNAVIQREPNHSVAHYLLCVAFARKSAFEQAVREGRESVRLAPSKGEAHFWLAESLRMSGQCSDARAEYSQYLRLSDFDSKLAGKINYYALGYLTGMGKKKRAAQQDIWMDLRNQAYFGLCDCNRLSKSFDDAIKYCETALTYDRQDPFSHYALGWVFLQKYNTAGGLGLLAAAREHFNSVIDFNANTDEAAKSKKYVQNIEDVLQRSH